MLLLRLQKIRRKSHWLIYFTAELRNKHYTSRRPERNNYIWATFLTVFWILAWCGHMMMPLVSIIIRSTSTEVIGTHHNPEKSGHRPRNCGKYKRLQAMLIWVNVLMIDHCKVLCQLGYLLVSRYSVGRWRYSSGALMSWSRGTRPRPRQDSENTASRLPLRRGIPRGFPSLFEIMLSTMSLNSTSLNSALIQLFKSK